MEARIIRSLFHALSLGESYPDVNPTTVPFLAHFIEPIGGVSSLGTQTGTRATEDPDSDEDYSNGGAEPAHYLGTGTVTDVGREDLDDDLCTTIGNPTTTKATSEAPGSDGYCLSQTHAFGTRTVTEVAGEERDEDVDAAMGTRTMTKVTNEEPDSDLTFDVDAMWEVAVL